MPEWLSIVENHGLALGLLVIIGMVAYGLWKFIKPYVQAYLEIKTTLLREKTQKELVLIDKQEKFVDMVSDHHARLSASVEKSNDGHEVTHNKLDGLHSDVRAIKTKIIGAEPV